MKGERKAEFKVIVGHLGGVQSVDSREANLFMGQES